MFSHFSACTLLSVLLRRYGYFCCWPCICDTKDFIHVDTKTVRTADGLRSWWWMVIANPCTQPSLFPVDAPELACSSTGELEGATLSDNGYVILTLFPLAGPGAAPAPDGSDGSDGSTIAAALQEGGGGTLEAQPEDDYDLECKDRMEMGYNSGMGDMFRIVAAITPIQTNALDE